MDVTQADLNRTDADTAEHIAKVQARIDEILENLLKRSVAHDASKRFEPERSGYASLRARLGDIRYGTPEYRDALNAARPTIEHHYAHNDHHPEHYLEDGIRGMSLMAILEMLADWKAAGERVKAGSLRQSLEVNEQRFGIDPGLMRILYNTARELGWLEEPCTGETTRLDGGGAL